MLDALYFYNLLEETPAPDDVLAGRFLTVYGSKFTAVSCLLINTEKQEMTYVM